jgi:DNA repair protein SbcD/Mre11
MRLLACGDFHIGAGAAYGSRPGDRLRDQERVLEEILDVFRRERCDVLLFAGDAFERRTPTPAELIVWRNFVAELAPNIVTIAGNHDVASADLPTGIEAVARYCARTPLVEPIGDNVTVACLPWTPPARLVASQGGGDRDELNAQVADLLIETARGLREQIPEGRTSILLGHWSVSGASTPTGMDVGLLREPVIPVHDLEEIGFDYVVLGHIHRRQLLGSENARGPILYVGSPMCLNFGEAREEHGVWIIDTDYTPSAATPVGYQFVPIDDRPFVTIDADLTLSEGGVGDMAVTGSGHDLSDGDGFSLISGPPPTPVRPSESVLDETDRITAAIAEHFPLTDAVVRLRYRATAEQARRVDHAALRGLLTDAGVSKLYSIAPEIVRSDRARVEGVDETMDAHEALIAWTQSQGIGGEVEERLEQLQNRYLEEVVA